jgi:hypothetical protein
MNSQALIVFVILLLGLLLCSFLGGNCNVEGMENNTKGKTNIDNAARNKNQSTTKYTSTQNTYDNYNHYNGSFTELQNGEVFVGENGGQITVNVASDGTQYLEITTPMDQTAVVYTPVPPEQDITSTTTTTITEGYTGAAAIKFYGPNGETATVVATTNGTRAIKVTNASGTYTYVLKDESLATSNTYTQYYGSTGYQYPPFSATAYNPPGYNPPGAVGPYNPPGYNPPGYQNPPGYNPPGAIGPQNPPGYNAPGSNYGPGHPPGYYDTLPPGIPASQIPPGQEDLYILKSEVVPPVCPACPSITAIPRQEPCPACPPCGRCPEPAFECKKVPNYNAGVNGGDYLPIPVLNDFSSFGM